MRATATIQKDGTATIRLLPETDNERRELAGMLGPMTGYLGAAAYEEDSHGGFCRGVAAPENTDVPDATICLFWEGAVS